MQEDLPTNSENKKDEPRALPFLCCYRQVYFQCELLYKHKQEEAVNGTVCIRCHDINSSGKVLMSNAKRTNNNDRNIYVIQKSQANGNRSSTTAEESSQTF